MLTDRRRLTEWFLFGALLVLNYLPVFKWMIWRYEESNSYSTHGYLIPFVSAWLVWSIRKTASGARQSGEIGGQVRLWGFFLIISSLLLHLISGIFDISSISGMSIIPLLAGFILFQLGREGLKRFWFPVVFLAFMVPLPDFIISSLNFKLKFLASDMAAWLLDITGLPAIRSGSFMLFSGERLGIGDVCSGLRSLISLMALGALYAWLIRDKGWKHLAATVIAIVPAAVFGNGLRICLVCYLVHWFGQPFVFKPLLGDYDIHLVTGMVIFLGAFFLLYSVNWAVGLLDAGKKEKNP